MKNRSLSLMGFMMTMASPVTAEVITPTDSTGYHAAPGSVGSRGRGRYNKYGHLSWKESRPENKNMPRRVALRGFTIND